MGTVCSGADRYLIERLAPPLFMMRPVITSGRLARPRGEQPPRRNHAFADRRGDFIDAEARAGLTPKDDVTIEVEPECGRDYSCLTP